MKEVIFLLIGLMIGFALYHIAFRAGRTGIIIMPSKQPYMPNGATGSSAAVDSGSLSIVESLEYQRLHDYFNEHTNWFNCKCELA
ncbi:MAG: hypothetical protein EBX41_00845 [Chitinophagia bacterium]|nr:hypothetical protein [Chitinophagia bacterium]